MAYNLPLNLFWHIMAHKGGRVTLYLQFPLSVLDNEYQFWLWPWWVCHEEHGGIKTILVMQRQLCARGYDSCSTLEWCVGAWLPVSDEELIDSKLFADNVVQVVRLIRTLLFISVTACCTLLTLLPASRISILQQNMPLNIKYLIIIFIIFYYWPPRWFSDQHVWLLIMRSRIRSPALPQILKNVD